MMDAVIRVARTFPNLRCFVLDGQVDANIAHMIAPSNSPLEHLILLSLAHCPDIPPNPFFGARSLAGLTYLDLSYTGGQSRALLFTSKYFTSGNLPNLRILKLAGKLLDISIVDWVLGQFGNRLWSIDLSCNKLGNELIPALREMAIACDHRTRLQSDRFFPLEGMLRPATEIPGTYFVQESKYSEGFTHPRRYIADTPPYIGVDTGSSSQLWERNRLRGQEPVRGDSADDVIRDLAGGPGDLAPMTPEICDPLFLPGTITHLHLNGLDLHSKMLEKLLEDNAGRIEHFECDRAKYLPFADGSEDWATAARWLRERSALYGFPGAAYLFRPVFQSNLRVLKIHHSLVTNVPTLSCGTGRVLENTWLSEKVFCKQNDLAFPQRFIPDMNPRLYSLTLSHIPRHSTGVVIDRLIHLLKLATIQEQEIDRTRADVPHRGPPVLHGLRHIRLEFEPDARDELASIVNGEDVSEAMNAFASFSETAWDSPSSRSSPHTGSSKSSTHPSSAPPRPLEAPRPPPSEEQLTGGPYDQLFDKQYCKVGPHGPSSVASSVGILVPVWIGTGVISPTNPPAINAYMRILAADARGKLLHDYAPASPSHVAAGVPSGSYIFWRAWDQILVPPPQNFLCTPTMAELRGMKDVLEEIKTFRSETRKEYHAGLANSNGIDMRYGGHRYWKGSLEIAFPHGRTGSSDYWR